MSADPKSEEYRETLSYNAHMKSSNQELLLSIFKDLTGLNSVYQSQPGLNPKNDSPK